MLGKVPDKSPILHNILKITLRCSIAGNGWLPLCNLWDFFALISLNSDLPSLLEYFRKNSPPLLFIFNFTLDSNRNLNCFGKLLKWKDHSEFHISCDWNFNPISFICWVTIFIFVLWYTIFVNLNENNRCKLALG